MKSVFNLINLGKFSLYRNVFFMLLGNGIFAFSQWLQLSLISKFTNISTLGTYTLGLGIVSPVFMFLGLQLRTILITDSKKDFNFSDFLNLRLILNILSLLIISIIVIFLKEKNVVSIVVLLAVQKISESFSELFNSNQQKLENINILAYSLILKGIGSAISVYIGLFFFKSIEIGVLLSVCFTLLVLFFYDYRNYKKYYYEKIKFNLNLQNSKKLFIKCFPLGVVVLIISLNANIAKYFLESYEGRDVQGAYSSISYILIVGIFIVDALGQTFVPRLSNYYYEKKLKNFKEIAVIFISVSILIGLGLSLVSFFFGDFILNLLFSKEIAKYSSFFSKYMFISILTFIASSLGYILTSIGEFKIQPFINATILIANFILSYFLIKIYGLDGTIITLAVCFIIQIIFTLIVLRKKLLVN